MLHPQARALLALEEGRLPVQDPANDVGAQREQARQAALAEPKEDVALVCDLDADGVRARLYRPVEGGDPLPVIVHLHGGGFVFNDVEVHDAVARRLANRSGMAVVSVDYRRPPEHRFPAAPDDVDAVIGWLTREGAGLGLDPGRMIAHGDSAGGNLALVAALRNPGRLAALVLIYPFIDAQMRHASYDEAVGLWNRGEAGWYWQQYARTDADFEDPDFSPYESDRLGTLPPTLVITSEHDPLRDEAEVLARRIAEAGVVCVGTRYLGMVHSFWRHPDAFDAAEPAMRQVTGFVHAYV